MRLTDLDIDGLKSLRRVHLRLARLMALFSPNGIGKTALMQAIRLAILGHEPSVGKQLVATRTLTEAGEIDVALSFDTGFGIRRIFGESEELRVTPSNGETGVGAGQSRIDEETGSFILSFDLAAFTALSPQKRKEKLFALLPRDHAGLTLDLFRHWTGYSEDDPTTVKAVDHLWTTHVLANSSALDGLQSAIEATRTFRNKAEQERLAQVKVSAAADGDAIAAANVAPYDEGAAQQMQNELGVVEQEVGELTERAAATARAERAIREHAHNVTVLEQKARDASNRHQATTQRLATLRAATHDVGALEAAEDLARRRAAGQRDAVTYAAEQVSSAAHEVRAAERTLTELKARIEAPVDEDLRACPECGAQIDVIVRAKLIAEAEEVDAALPPLRAAHEAAREKLLEAEQRQIQLDGAEREARIDLRRAREHTETVRAAEAELARIEDASSSLEQELGRLRESPPAAAEQYDTERLAARQTEARVLRDRIREQQELLRAVGRSQADRERADRERKKLALLEDKSSRLGTLLSSLLKLRAHVLQEMVAPVEQHAQEILQAIDPAKRFAFVFEREGKDHLDFGFEQDGSFRPFKAASKGESIFLAAVFVAAMIAVVQPNWRVLMIDDVEGLDAENLRWLMVALAQVSDRFDNIILGSCRAFPEVDVWEIVDVRELAPKMAAVA